MDIKEAVSISFKALGKKEAHVNDIAEHIVQHIAEFQGASVEDMKKKVNSFLAANVKSKTPVYAKVTKPRRR